VNYLLDTNIRVFVIWRKAELVLRRFKQHGPDQLGISTVTLAERCYGADKSSNPAKNHTLLGAFLAPLRVVAFDAESAEYYGTIRAELEGRGLPIGPFDTMIAAHALRLGLPLVTNNSREFQRVPGLTIEDWTKC